MNKLIAILALTASFSANAAIVNLGTITPQDTTNTFSLFGAGVGDNYNFTVNQGFAFTALVSAYDVVVPGFTISLSKVGSGFLFSQDTTTAAPTIPGFTNAFDLEVNEKVLSAGSYTFSITGNSSDGSSAYAGSFTVGRAPAVAAVPEPETYAMFLAGLGLLGFAARRRQN